MAHGLRGRVAAIGAGVVLCTGLVGCMDTGKKPVAATALPVAKGTTPTPPGGRPAALPANGMGMPTQGGFQQGVVQPAAGSYQSPANTTNFGNPNPNNFGSMGAPTVPGPAGPGAPIPGTTNSAVPSVMPVGAGTSNYPPQGGYPAPAPAYPMQPGYGPTSSLPAPGSPAVAPGTARGTAPSGPAAHPVDPPMMTLLPPSAPTGAGFTPSSELAPPVAPTLPPERPTGNPPFSTK